MGEKLWLAIGYSHFIIRRFYPDGDKFLLIFASILSLIGIAMIYRIKPDEGIKQVVWFIIGVVIYILTVVLLPGMKKLSKYKYIYLGAVSIFMPLATIFGKEVYGAKNWVFIGSTFGFQPSEFGKIALEIGRASCRERV